MPRAGSMAMPSRLLLEEATRRWYSYYLTIEPMSMPRADTMAMPSRLLLEEATIRWYSST
jgi:hypothetical protein